MPAPQATALKAMITTQLLAKGFVKKTYVNNVLTPTPGQLPDKLADLVEGVSAGIANEWTVWQASQPVTGTAGPFPVVGTLP